MSPFNKDRDFVGFGKRNVVMSIDNVAQMKRDDDV